MSHAFRSTVFALSILGLATACGDRGNADAASASEVAALRADVEGLVETNRAIQASLRSQALQMSRLEAKIHEGVSGPRASMHGVDQDVPPAGAAGTGSDPSSEVGSVVAEGVVEELTPQAINKLLATEEGREAIRKATKSAVRSEARRARDVMVAYELGVFGRTAGLTDEQTKSIQAVWKDTITQVRQAMAKSQAASKGTPEEKARARAEVMQVMRDLGARRTERVRDLLDAEQFALYEKKEPEIDAALHGAPQRPPERPSR